MKYPASPKMKRSTSKQWYLDGYILGGRNTLRHVKTMFQFHVWFPENTPSGCGPGCGSSNKGVSLFSLKSCYSGLTFRSLAPYLLQNKLTSSSLLVLYTCWFWFGAAKQKYSYVFVLSFWWMTLDDYLRDSGYSSSPGATQSTNGKGSLRSVAPHKVSSWPGGSPRGSWACWWM